MLLSFCFREMLEILDHQAQKARQVLMGSLESLGLKDHQDHRGHLAQAMGLDLRCSSTKRVNCIYKVIGFNGRTAYSLTLFMSNYL